jgi:hypothetical protein
MYFLNLKSDTQKTVGDQYETLDDQSGRNDQAQAVKQHEQVRTTIRDLEGARVT